MNNFINLVRINLKNTFSLDKQINTKNNAGLKKIGISLLFLYLFVYLTFYSFIISRTMMKGLVALNTPYILPTAFMVISSCFLVFSDIFKINGSLFNTKDHDLLNSLPIKSNLIILSKLFCIYVENLLIIFITMIPAFIVYLMNINVPTTFIIYYIITMFLIPIVPIIISTIVGSVISYLASYFNKKNLFSFIATILLVILAFYFSYGMGSMDPTKLADIGTLLVDKFNSMYPLTKVYVDIIKDANFLSFVIYLATPIILTILYLLLMKKNYGRINSRLASNHVKANYKLTKLKTNSVLKALFIKDAKRFYSSYLYVFNTCMGAILLTLMSVALLVMGQEKLEDTLNMPGVIDFLKVGMPLMIGAFCLLNSTTQASISIEGRSLKLLKSLPVTPSKIFLSKILVNFTIYIPMILINAAILTIYFKLGIVNFIVCIIVALIYAIFASLLGLVINLLFPQLEWDNEVRVVKQSVASFVTIMLGMVLAIAPIALAFTLKNVDLKMFTLIICAVLSLFSLFMIMYLRTIGTRKFNELA